jgi:hypothetical protein
MGKDGSVDMTETQVKQFVVQFHTDKGGKDDGLHLFKQQAETVTVERGRTEVESPVGNLYALRKALRLGHGIDEGQEGLAPVGNGKTPAGLNLPGNIPRRRPGKIIGHLNFRI